jgi:hypothetical protein
LSKIMIDLSQFAAWSQHLKKFPLPKHSYFTVGITGSVILERDKILSGLFKSH